MASYLQLQNSGSNGSFSSAQKKQKSPQTSPLPIHKAESKQSMLAARRPLPIPQIDGNKSPKPPQGSPLSLYQLAKGYSKQLPLRVEILQGYYGQNVQLELCTGDAYNVHFMKETQVFSIQDEHKDRYNVPLNSAFQFGLVQHHSDTVEGHVYAKVSDVVTLKQLPKVIAATKAFTGPTEKSSVQEGEILVVCGVHKTRAPNSKKGLKVISLSTKAEKILWSDCSAHFSTDPALVCMHLPDIARYMSEAFPLETRMYLREDHTAEHQLHNIPSSFLSSTITITGRKTVTSLIISSVAENEEECSPMDIPVDDNLLGVEVSIIESMSMDDVEELREQTRNILVGYNPARAKLLLDVPLKRIYKAQSLLYAAYQAGCEGMGIDLHSCIGEDVPSITSSEADPEEENVYETLAVYEPVPYLNTMHAESRNEESDTNTKVEGMRDRAVTFPPKKSTEIRRRATTTALSENRTSDPYSYLQTPPQDPATFLETQSKKFETENTRTQKSTQRKRSKTVGGTPKSRRHRKEASHDVEEYIYPVLTRRSPQLDSSSELDIPSQLKIVEDKLKSMEAQHIEQKLANEELTLKVDEIADKLKAVEATMEKVLRVEQQKPCSSSRVLGDEEENTHRLCSLDTSQVNYMHGLKPKSSFHYLQSKRLGLRLGTRIWIPFIYKLSDQHCTLAELCTVFTV